MTDSLVWLILLPLIWASLAFVAGPGGRGRLAILALGLQLLLAFDLALDVTASGRVGHAVGGWGAPLGIDLAADGLSVVMLLLTQMVALPLAIYARAYFTATAPEARYFWPLCGFLLAGLNGLYLSVDLFNLYVTLELIGLAAVGLVAADGGSRQIAAALRYLFATLVGSGAYLLAVALIYATYGTVSMANLAPLVTAQAPVAVLVAGGLMLVGLMLKTALFPFHFWLPPAHGGASAPVSSLLSAIVVKASFYLLLRLWLGPFAGLTADAGLIAWIPATLGALAIFWGSYQAIRAWRIKMLIAYSTVAQLGYLFLIFPLLPGEGALRAGIMQAFAHALAKAAMFMAAGALIKATGQEKVDDLAGAAQRMPLTMFAFGLAGVTLTGLPPSAGFLGKWLLIETALGQGAWIIAVVALAGGLLAAGYVFRVLRQGFLLVPVSSPDAPVFHPVPRTLEWMALLLAAASSLLGLRAVELMELIPIGGAI